MTTDVQIVPTVDNVLLDQNHQTLWYKIIMSHLLPKKGHTIIFATQAEISLAANSFCEKLVSFSILEKKNLVDGIGYRLKDKNLSRVNYDCLISACFTSCFAGLKKGDIVTTRMIEECLNFYLAQLIRMGVVFPADRCEAARFRLAPGIINTYRWSLPKEDPWRPVASNPEKVSQELEFVSSTVDYFNLVSSRLRNGARKKTFASWLLAHPESLMTQTIPFFNTLTQIRVKLPIDVTPVQLNEEAIGDKHSFVETAVAAIETAPDHVSEHLSSKPEKKTSAEALQHLKDMYENAFGEMIITRNRKVDDLRAARVQGIQQNNVSQSQLEEMIFQILALQNEIDAIRSFRKMAREANLNRISRDIGQDELIARLIYREDKNVRASIRDLKAEQRQLSLSATRKAERRIDSIDNIIIRRLEQLDTIDYFQEIYFPASAK